MQTLKRCPFCHKTSYLKVEPFFEPSFDGYYGFTVVCSAAGFDNTERGCGSAGAWGETEEDAATSWNTRPAAPVEGLETVRYEIIETLPSGSTRWQCAEHKLSANSIAVNNEHPSVVNALVPRSQAEAIIAAERERADAVHKADAKAFLSMNSRYEKAEADNAALTARVDEYETGLVQMHQEMSALETQLAAVRKALERAVYGFDQIHSSLMGNGPKQASGEVTAFFLDETRAALEDKP